MKAYTYGSAFGAYEEHLKGSIEPGFAADLVVLDTDLFSTYAQVWKDASVKMTFLNGEIIYEKQ